MTTDAPDPAFETALSAAETWVGTHPEEGTAVALTNGELRNSCYVQGAVPEQQTALCQRLCLQWAHAGLGFCYVHAGGPELLDLVYALPADRLDDIVWIDLDRQDICSHLSVPKTQVVCLEAFDGPEPPVRERGLISDPIDGRLADLMDICSERDEFDWNVATLLSAVLPSVFRDDDLTMFGDPGVSSAFMSAQHATDTTPLLELVPSNERETIGVQLKRAFEHDPNAVLKAKLLLSTPVDRLQYYNPLGGETTYSFSEGLEENAIVLVRGDFPSPHEPNGLGAEIAASATQLLTLTVLRRLWEALQARAESGPETETQPVYPLVVDGMGELCAGDGSLFRELLSNQAETPLALIGSGPETNALPEELALEINDHAGIMITFEEHATEGIQRSLVSQDTATMERALANEATNAVADAPVCWVQTNREGVLVGKSRQSETMPVRPFGAVSRQRTDSEVETALTQSVQSHGRNLSWPDEDGGAGAV